MRIRFEKTYSEKGSKNRFFMHKQGFEKRSKHIRVNGSKVGQKCTKSGPKVDQKWTKGGSWIEKSIEKSIEKFSEIIHS